MISMATGCPFNRISFEIKIIGTYDEGKLQKEIENG